MRIASSSPALQAFSGAVREEAMKSQSVMRKDVDDCINLIDARLAKRPQDHRLEHVRSELIRIAADVSRSWPMPFDEASKLRIGLFAVRELEGVDDDIAICVRQISSDIKSASGVI